MIPCPWELSKHEISDGLEVNTWQADKGEDILAPDIQRGGTQI
jgi:hypothetical protein